MKKGRQYGHIALSLDLAGISAEQREGLMTYAGRKLTGAEVLRLRDVLRAHGFEVFPSCAKVDVRGVCQGHATHSEGGMWNMPEAWAREAGLTS